MSRDKKLCGDDWTQFSDFVVEVQNLVINYGQTKMC